MADWIFETAGLSGVLVYLASYALLQTGMIRGDGYSYALLNILAASLVLASLVVAFNLSSFLIQVSFILISLFGIVRIYLINRAISFSPEEKEMLTNALPLSPQAVARQFFDAGRWEFIPEGTVVMREGEAHGQLLYVSQGVAQVSTEGAIVGTVESGAFLGEMTVLYGTPATATVKITEPSRVFRITGDALTRLMGSSPDFRLILEGSLARDTGRKLTATNAALAEVTNVRKMTSKTAS